MTALEGIAAHPATVPASHISFQFVDRGSLWPPQREPTCSRASVVSASEGKADMAAPVSEGCWYARHIWTRGTAQGLGFIRALRAHNCRPRDLSGFARPGGGLGGCHARRRAVALLPRQRRADLARRQTGVVRSAFRSGCRRHNRLGPLWA